MILQNKNAVIYGAGGSIGSTIAKAFAQAGAKVFLTGRNLPSVQNVADGIIASGGKAEAAKADALDEVSVNNHVGSVIKNAGKIDISFNCIGLEVVQNMPLIEMSVEDFVRPSQIAMRSHFLTATTAATAMKQQGGGVILSLTATPGGIGYPYTAGFAPACSAIESFYRNLAAETGIYGIRAVNIRSGGSPDSAVFKRAIDTMPDVMEGVLRKMKADTMLKTLPLMADIANLAVFLVSDLAAKITGVTVDVTCGTTAALNHRVDMVNPGTNISE
jgi:NAD(P)-dependent dehydrogenase (short-subunit alcohol dehydrogenase family)